MRALHGGLPSSAATSVSGASQGTDECVSAPSVFNADPFNATTARAQPVAGQHNSRRTTCGDALDTDAEALDADTLDGSRFPPSRVACRIDRSLQQMHTVVSTK